MNLALKNLQRDRINKVLAILMTKTKSCSRVNVISINIGCGFSVCVSLYESGIYNLILFIIFIPLI